MHFLRLRTFFWNESLLIILSAILAGTQLMKKIFICTILILFSLTGQAHEKTICSMTLNSNEEIELFKNNLAPLGWKFIELVPKNEEPNKENWLQLSCEQKVKCDVLVVSGHFGGTFFGSSRYQLTTEELESKSCQTSCDGIFNQPKEVFLFGCNTLANKDKDQRSPEEYMQILRTDGISDVRASEIVSFRYSMFGESFNNRMSLVFAKVPKIYGFHSYAPLGKRIKPMLSSYLEDSITRYENFSSNWFSNTSKNEDLFKALKKTNIAQTQGSNLNINSASEKPYCYIKNNSISHLEKLRYVKLLFEKNRALNILSHIQIYLHEVLKNFKTLTPSEKNMFSSIKNLKNIKEDLMAVLKLKGDVYLPIKAHVLNTLFDLDIIDKEFSVNAFVDLLKLNSTVTNQRKDMICSTNTSFQIPFEAIPEARWSEMNFLTILICLKANSDEIQERFTRLITQASSPAIRATAIWYFERIKTQNVQIKQILREVEKSDPDINVRKSAELVLKNLTQK